MTKKTVRELDVAGKKILLRVDYNVPLENGQVRDDFRITASLPTINYLLEQNCALILASHLGRPEGKVNPELSLAPTAETLADLLERDVAFVPDIVGEKAQAAAADLEGGQLILLENLRFDEREEKNDAEFAKQLASMAEVFVDDAFAAIHRAHASIVGVAKLLPAVAGLLVEKEVDTITEALESPSRPLLAMIGGAKVSDKIELLNNLIKKVDTLVIGGAMANTFLAAQGVKIGRSVYEPGQTATAKRILDTAKIRLVLPADAVVAEEIRPPTAVRSAPSLDMVGKGDFIADIGPQTIEQVGGLIMDAGTVIWNGPFGLAEIPEFANGSLALARCLADSKAKSVIGGGDTAEFIDSAGLHEKFDLVSTGGGAALELMAGKKLPGVEALLDK